MTRSKPRTIADFTGSFPHIIFKIIEIDYRGHLILASLTFYQIALIMRQLEIVLRITAARPARQNMVIARAPFFPERGMRTVKPVTRHRLAAQSTLTGLPGPKLLKKRGLGRLGRD